MVRQSVVSQKKRGPPATGKGEPIMVRIQPDRLKEIDAWIAYQEDKPSRPEAIRRLVALSLRQVKPSRELGKKATAKASDMAGKEIDRMGDKSATNDERASRKRRLLKGPKEFREMRGDLSKPKR
jgi:hypothetical protein